MPSEEADPFNGVGMGRPGGNNMMPVPPTGELMGEDEPNYNISRFQFSRNLGSRPGQRGGRR